jgi:hypothetical protein
MATTSSIIIAPTPTQVDPKDQTEVRKALSDLTQSVNTQFNSLNIPSAYSGPAWKAYPDGTYVFPSGNQTVIAGILPIGAVTTAPTFGTGTILKAWWRDYGKTIDIWIQISQSTLSGAASGTGIYLIPLPLGKLFDTNIIMSTGLYDGQAFGSGSLRANGYFASVCSVAYNSNTFKLSGLYSGGAISFEWNSGVLQPSAFSSLTFGMIACGIPIQ